MDNNQSRDLLTNNKRIRTTTLVGMIINILLSIGKLISGMIGRSGAMLADGVHSLSDSLTDIIVLIGIRFTKQPPDKHHNYGHEKFETISTAIISIFLIVVGVEILKNGISDIVFVARGNVLESPGMIALYAALVSIIVKEFLYRYTVIVGKDLKNTLVIANAWHHRSDAFSSIGTLIGISGAIFLGSKWTILDPIASILISLFIFRVAYQILKPAVQELTEKALPQEQIDIIKSVIESQEDVKNYHHLHTRSLGRKSVIEVHIRLDSEMSVDCSHNIASRIEALIKARLENKVVMTIHIEPHYKFIDM